MVRIILTSPIAREILTPSFPFITVFNSCTFTQNCISFWGHSCNTSIIYDTHTQQDWCDDVTNFPKKFNVLGYQGVTYYLKDPLDIRLQTGGQFLCPIFSCLGSVGNIWEFYGSAKQQKRIFASKCDVIYECTKSESHASSSFYY